MTTVEDGLDGVRALLPGARLELVDQLGGSRRSRVRRVRADSDSLIVKEFAGSDEGWVRESASLSVLPGEVRAPRLVAAGAVPPIVVMSDLGRGTSVADALLGKEPAVAADAVVQWATAIGVLHRATSGLRDAFHEALKARAGDLPISESTLADDLESAAANMARHCPELGVHVPAGAWEELRALATRLTGDGRAALTPADACPDNNLQTEDGLALIDFEGAQWRHIAWDLAYLIVPWPSCWCSWRIPVGVAERAMDAYQTASNVSDVDTAGFHRDVDAAVVGWAYVSTSWFLPRALPDIAPVAKPGRPAPSYRAMILHRLDLVRRSAETPALAGLSDRLHNTLTARWGEVILPYAPAFG
jgi:hypothetical protein